MINLELTGGIRIDFGSLWWQCNNQIDSANEIIFGCAKDTSEPWPKYLNPGLLSKLLDNRSLSGSPGILKRHEIKGLLILMWHFIPRPLLHSLDMFQSLVREPIRDRLTKWQTNTGTANASLPIYFSCVKFSEWKKFEFLYVAPFSSYFFSTYFCALFFVFSFLVSFWLLNRFLFRNDSSCSRYIVSLQIILIWVFASNTFNLIMWWSYKNNNNNSRS